MDSPWPSTAAVGVDGALSVGGADVRQLAGEFGTPLYVIDEADMRGRARAFKDDFAAAFTDHGAECDVFYASKAFLSSRVSSWFETTARRS